MKKSALVLISAVFSGLLLSACGGHASDKSVPPKPNAIPQANAGTAQSVIGGSTVTLDGGASYDPDGQIASFAWTQTAGPSVTLLNPTSAQAAFISPSVTGATDMTFSLVVTDYQGAASTASSVTITANPPTPGTLTGAVRFMRIPTSATYLDYAAQQLQPARGVVIEAVDATTSAVLATGVTSLNGTYVLQVPANQSARIVVVSQMLRQNPQALPHWNFTVSDATNPYTYNDGVVLDTSAPVVHDIGIPSGYDSTGGSTGTRHSAPFAVLDTVYKAVQLVLTAQPNADFPALLLDWSTLNPGGETFFDASTESITISGKDTEDTDEFDEHVVAHEFGHYLEHSFSRGDSVGGAHALGDKLDIRVAFSEGFGYAFSAMVLNDPVARDTFIDPSCTVAQPCFGCNVSRCTSEFNVEDNPAANPNQAVPVGNYACYCSESSVWSLLWDVYDSTPDGADTLSLGFVPIWTVMINEQRTTHAFTSIFSFMAALKSRNPTSASALAILINSQNTNGDGIDQYGSGEVYAPTSPAFDSNAALPMYTDITIGGPPVTLRTVDDAGYYNALGNRRFLKFTLLQTATFTITATSSKTPGGDADFYLYLDGAFYDRHWTIANPEVHTYTNAPPGDYVIDVQDYANADSDCGLAPGCGTGDFDLTVQIN